MIDPEKKKGQQKSPEELAELLKLRRERAQKSRAAQKERQVKANKTGLIQELDSCRQESLQMISDKRMSGIRFLRRNPYKKSENQVEVVVPKSQYINNNKSEDGSIKLSISLKNTPSSHSSGSRLMYKKGFGNKWSNTECSGFDEYADTAILYLITSNRDMVMSPKCYIGTADIGNGSRKQTSFLSSYISSDSSADHPSFAPMHNYMKGLIIAKAEHDPNQMNYLKCKNGRGKQVALRIDHASSYRHDKNFPTSAESLDGIFKCKINSSEFPINDFNNRFKKSNFITEDGESVECFNIAKGSEEKYMLLVRGIKDFTTLPESIVDEFYDNYISHAKENKVEIDLADVEDKRIETKELQSLSSQYFSNELKRFDSMVKTPKYKGSITLSDIDWDTFKLPKKVNDIMDGKSNPSKERRGSLAEAALSGSMENISCSGCGSLRM